MSDIGNPTSPENPRIVLPDLCKTHQVLLVRQLEIGPDGPWRAAMVMAQAALFQAATALDKTHARIGGDITRIGELGCLACYRPDAFGEIIQAATAGGLSAIKAVGQRYVDEASKP